MSAGISSVSCSIYKIGGMSGSSCGAHPVNEVFTRYNQNMSGSGYYYTLQYSASVNGVSGTWQALETKVLANGTTTQYYHDLGCVYYNSAGSGSVYKFCYKAATFNGSSTSSIVYGNVQQLRIGGLLGCRANNVCQ